jgi:hypothetical protein
MIYYNYSIKLKKYIEVYIYKMQRNSVPLRRNMIAKNSNMENANNSKAGGFSWVFKGGPSAQPLKRTMPANDSQATESTTSEELPMQSHNMQAQSSDEPSETTVENSNKKESMFESLMKKPFQIIQDFTELRDTEPKKHKNNETDEEFLNAIKEGNYSLAEQLLTEISHICISDANNNTAFHYIALNTTGDLNATEKQLLTKIFDCLKRKCGHKKCLDFKNNNGQAALHIAFEKGNQDLMKILIDNGADQKNPDKEGYAIQFDSSKIKGMASNARDSAHKFGAQARTSLTSRQADIETPLDMGLVEKYKHGEQTEESVQQGKSFFRGKEAVMNKYQLTKQQASSSFDALRNKSQNRMQPLESVNVSHHESSESPVENKSMLPNSADTKQIDVDRLLGMFAADTPDTEQKQAQSGGRKSKNLMLEHSDDSDANSYIKQGGGKKKKSGKSKKSKVKGTRKIHYNLTSLIESDYGLQRDFDEAAQKLHAETVAEIEKLGYSPEEAKIYKAALWKRAKALANEKRDKGEKVTNIDKSQFMLDMVNEKTLKEIKKSGEYKETEAAIEGVMAKKADREKNMGSDEAPQGEKKKRPKKEKN